MKMKCYLSQIIYYLLIVLITLACSKEEKENTSSSYRSPVGSSARNFLSSEKYKKLVVEVQYMSNYAPTQDAIDNLESFLSQRLNKPNGIESLSKRISPKNKATYSVSDIMNIEANSRTRYFSGNEIAAYFLFLDGEYVGNTGDSKVLGIAYGSTSMAIFEETVHQYSDDIITEPSRERLETTVLNHEFGHLLGLVNIGTDMVVNHQDTQHGHHCNDKDCLMYYTVETTDIVASLIGGNIPELDNNCLDDLRANGGK